MSDAELTGLSTTATAHTNGNGLAQNTTGQTSFNLTDKLREMNKQYAMITEGPNIGSILVKSTDPLTDWPMIHFASTEQLHKRYANRNVTLNDNRSHNIFTIWLNNGGRRDIKGIVFAPGQQMGEDYHNLWQGFAVEPQPGDCSLYLQHIREVIASGDEEIYRYIIAWMADAVQHPGQRPGISLVLQGKMGAGKGVFVSQFGKLFGPHYKPLTHSRQLTGRFNNHLQDALIVFADEAFLAGDRQAEGVVKALVTEDMLPVEPKKRDIYWVQNHIRLIVASDKGWVVPAGLEERRFCVLQVAETHMQDAAYFMPLLEQMDHGGREALLHYLLHEVDISGVHLRHIPRTAALFEQMVRNMEPVPRFWYNLLMRGAFYDAALEHDDWPGQVEIPCPTLYEKYADFLGRRRPKRSEADADTDEADFGKKIREWVPSGFRRYRPRNANGGRPYVYVIPPLAACRAFFQEKVKAPITWPSAAEDAEHL